MDDPPKRRAGSLPRKPAAKTNDTGRVLAPRSDVNFGANRPEDVLDLPELINLFHAICPSAFPPFPFPKEGGGRDEVNAAIANSNGSGSDSKLSYSGSGKGQNLQSPEFRRSDCRLYVSNLPQKAGVPSYQIRKLVLKELVDNALDEMDAIGKPGLVTVTQDDDHIYTVTDQGRGIPGSPKEIAEVFSFDKPMTSTKQWRMITRGCVGNGLRVIVGSVASGGGRIVVATKNREIILQPRVDGTTDVVKYSKIDWPVGTSISIEIDPKFPLREIPWIGPSWRSR